MTDHATWISFSNSEVEALQDILNNAMAPDREVLLDRIALYLSLELKDQRYRDAAEILSFVRDGECEIDDHAVVSKGDDAGAYVMAWVWVADDEKDEDDYEADIPYDTPSLDNSFHEHEMDID